MSALSPVLIIEDVHSMRELLAQVVSGIEGLKLSGQAKNVWEARLELSRRRPALVLLDEILPGESSVDLLIEMHAQSIPVLLLTGIEDPSHPIPEGALGRLVKPTWESLAADQERFRLAIFSALGL